MGFDFTDSFKVEGTLVSNRFIDEHMASANGEYVKVYLYLLRHEGENINFSAIADALEHTEADIRRALAFWEKAGVLSRGAAGQEKTGQVKNSSEEKQTDSKVSVQAKAQRLEKRRSYTPDQMERLTAEEDFAQLLYIAQKYLKKVFTPRDSEVFAYLYDGLHMSLELLEYLVEYCAQNGHSSLRYVETVALNWHERGLLTVEAARNYTEGFAKDTYSVMRAFGLTDRQPAKSEIDKIQAWYKDYGFTREIILEACNRTMEAIHTPSFPYADKILAQWYKAGVRAMSDIEALDKNRSTRTVPSQEKTKTTARNQFHNFDQRDTDYDALVLEQWKEQS